MMRKRIGCASARIAARLAIGTSTCDTGANFLCKEPSHVEKVARPMPRPPQRLRVTAAVVACSTAVAGRAGRLERRRAAGLQAADPARDRAGRDAAARRAGPEPRSSASTPRPARSPRSPRPRGRTASASRATGRSTPRATRRSGVSARAAGRASSRGRPRRLGRSPSRRTARSTSRRARRSGGCCRASRRPSSQGSPSRGSPSRTGSRAARSSGRRTARRPGGRDGADRGHGEQPDPQAEPEGRDDQDGPRVRQPSGIALATGGAYWVARPGQHVVVKVSAAGRSTVYAGNGQQAFAGEEVSRRPRRSTRPTHSP